jgi:hypothetical protein
MAFLYTVGLKMGCRGRQNMKIVNQMKTIAPK